MRQYNSQKHIPFLLIAGRFMQAEAGFTLKILVTHTFRQTETELRKLQKAESEIRKAIDGEAQKLHPRKSSLLTDPTSICPP